MLAQWKRFIRHPLWWLSGIVVIAALAIPGWLFYSSILAKHYLQKAEAAVQADKLLTAREAIRRSLSWKKTPKGHFLAARFARQMDEIETARHHLEQLKALTGTTEDYQLEQLLIRAQIGEVEAVAPVLWQYIHNRHPEGDLCREALCRGYLLLERYAEADHLLREWLQEGPQSAQRNYCHGLLQEQLYQCSGAIKCYQAIIDNEPDRHFVRFRLARLLVLDGSYASAAPHFRTLLSQGIQQREVQAGLASCYANLNQLEEAKTICQKLLATKADDPEALHILGLVALNQAQPEEAENLLRESVRLQPYNHLPRYHLLQSLRQQGKEVQQESQDLEQMEKNFDEIQKLTREELARNPGDPDLYHRLGKLYFAIGHQERAFRSITTALQISPRHQASLRFLQEYRKPSLTTTLKKSS